MAAEPLLLMYAVCKRFRRYCQCNAIYMLIYFIFFTIFSSLLCIIYVHSSPETSYRSLFISALYTEFAWKFACADLSVKPHQSTRPGNQKHFLKNNKLKPNLSPNAIFSYKYNSIHRNILSRITSI